MRAKNICKRPYPGGDAQGFVTDKGKFVSRKEALKIAKMAGQIPKDHKYPELFSEDMWGVNGEPILKQSTREPYHSLDMHDGIGEDDGY